MKRRVKSDKHENVTLAERGAARQVCVGLRFKVSKHHILLEEKKRKALEQSQTRLDGGCAWIRAKRRAFYSTDSVQIITNSHLHPLIGIRFRFF